MELGPCFLHEPIPAQIQRCVAVDPQFYLVKALQSQTKKICVYIFPLFWNFDKRVAREQHRALVRTRFLDARAGAVKTRGVYIFPFVLPGGTSVAGIHRVGDSIACGAETCGLVPHLPFLAPGYHMLCTHDQSVD